MASHDRLYTMSERSESEWSVHHLPPYPNELTLARLKGAFGQGRATDEADTFEPMKSTEGVRGSASLFVMQEGTFLTFRAGVNECWVSGDHPVLNRQDGFEQTRNPSSRL